MGIKDLNLAIVDVETTGSRLPTDRIIEIGVLRIEKGKLVEKFNSFVNPYRPISPLITDLTGITDADVADAPDFSEISLRLRELLEGSVFVAHSVGFDYGFLKSEFNNHEQPFAPPRLCTVRLSRALYPAYRHHNLDSLIERFNFTCKNRHRALDDAKVLWKFLENVQKEFAPKKLEQIVSQLVQFPAPEATQYIAL